MFEFSRALYRHVGPWAEPGDGARATIVHAAEAAVERLQGDPQNAPRVARTLFREIRFLFPLSRQAEVRRAVEAVCVAAAREADRRSRLHIDEDGRRRQCPESTRQGTPCRREPLANGHCPSHQHLLERYGQRPDPVLAVA